MEEENYYYCVVLGYRVLHHLQFHLIVGHEEKLR